MSTGFLSEITEVGKSDRMFLKYKGGKKGKRKKVNSKFYA
jgi:hypothetical protein